MQFLLGFSTCEIVDKYTNRRYTLFAEIRIKGDKKFSIFMEIYYFLEHNGLNNSFSIISEEGFPYG